MYWQDREAARMAHGGRSSVGTVRTKWSASRVFKGNNNKIPLSKGIVGYFHRSTSGIQDLTGIQNDLRLTAKQPDLGTRTWQRAGFHPMAW